MRCVAWKRALVLAFVGCNPEGTVDGLTDTLFDDDKARLDAPGVQVMSGRHSDLVLDGVADSLPQLLSLRHRGDETSLSVTRLELSEATDSCEVEGVSRFIPLSFFFPRLSVEELWEPLIGVYGDVTSNRDIPFRLVNYECDERVETLHGSVPRAVIPGDDPRALVLMSGDGDLSLLDMASLEVRLLAKNVDFVRTFHNHLWAGIGRQLVLYEPDGKEVGRFGEEVQSLTRVQGGAAGARRALWVDGSNLFQLTLATESDGRTTAAVEEIGADVCELTALDGRTVSYFSPCDERRLNVRDFGADRTDTYLDGVASPQQVQRFEEAGVAWTLFLTGPEDAEQGKLWAVSGEEEPVALAEGASLRFNGALVTVASMDPEGELARVVTATGEPEVQTLGSSVGSSVIGLARDSWLVVADLESSRGTLTHITADGGRISREELAFGVPEQPLSFSRGSSSLALAFIGDVSATRSEPLAGALYTAEAPWRGARALGPQARVGSVQWLSEPSALLFLGPEGGASGALSAWLFDLERSLLIAPRASEFQPVTWPIPGVLYAVDEGEGSGIWFSRAR